MALKIGWWAALKSLCRVHQTLRVTPAMEADLADHIWSLEELVGLSGVTDDRGRVSDGLFNSVLILLALVAYIAIPVVLISGWVRWARRSHPRGLLPALTLIGFTFGTASALLAICTASYALVVRGFPYYDPVLLKI